jgi:hypothetical protein
MADRAFDIIRGRKLFETASEHFLQVLNSGTVSTNMFLRRLHNFAVGTRAAVSSIIMGLPGSLRKKMFALQSRIEAMARMFGLNHIGMQTLTIRENVTDGREFNKRFKSISTNIFPKLYQAWIRVCERQQRGAWHVHVIVATKADIRGGTDAAGRGNRMIENGCSVKMHPQKSKRASFN